MYLYKEDIIKKALCHIQIFENSNFEVSVNSNTNISVNLFNIVLILISNFAIAQLMTDSEIKRLFRIKGDSIKEVIKTHIEIRLLQFANTYLSCNKSEMIEFDEINMTLLALAIQDNVNKEIKKYI